ncbi:glucosamine 6-phosphate n-acetyltransferase [Stylonychia lemnae]|uniref:Glucosamine 6-phosphate N-acetyltransferase n=1 Tax=Stylonychia lemnae TaxID=5949 RepID=A0A078A7U2_STYLE|nr:glucosamine 6-phosphate n-acetyltransferase [Stylonychia lemnae]|eukprot:CDW77906.1 glucosamine 6-phosphate n-acetyltransferase [Stylonychia lemnae]
MKSSNSSQKTLSPADMLKMEAEILKKASDSEFEFRHLRRDDFEKGFLDTLSQLTVVGQVTKEDFEKRFDEMFPKRQEIYKIIVLLDKRADYIIGAGTVFFEKKFIRNTSTCGHIEDVNVDSTYRGNNLGVRMINILKEISCLNNCYKIIVDCADHNIKFYELVTIFQSFNINSVASNQRKDVCAGIVTRVDDDQIT